MPESLQQTCRSSVAVAQEPAGPIGSRCHQDRCRSVECRGSREQDTVSCSNIFGYRVDKLARLAVLQHPYWKLTEVAVPFLLDASMHAGPALQEPRGASLGLAPLSRPCEGVLLCNLIASKTHDQKASNAQTPRANGSPCHPNQRQIRGIVTR